MFARSIACAVLVCGGIVASLLGLPRPSSAQSAPIVFVDPGPTLVWRALNIETGQSEFLGELGTLGNHIALGRWLGTGGVQLGVVALDPGSREVIWKVLGANGPVEMRFGMAGDLAVAAADFDGTGIDDPVIVSTKGRLRVWTIAFDLFRGGRRRMKFTLGERTEAPFFINFDGSGPWLGTVAVGKRSTTIRLLNPRTGKRQVLRRLPAIPGSGAPKPVALSGPQGAKLLAVSRREGSTTRVSLINLKTRLVSTQMFALGGDLIVGDLLPEAGEEFALVSNSSIVVRNPFSGVQTAVDKPSGDPVLVDRVNINAISAGPVLPTPPPPPRPTPRPANTPTPRPGGGTGNPPASLNTVCASRSAIGAGEMLIKSDASSHIHTGDPRTTGYTVVCARICPSNQGYAQFFYSDGSFAGAVAKYGTFRGNGKPRLYGAVGRAPQHFAAEIAAKAASIGNGKLYLQISTATEGASTACKEFHPSGRNGSLY